MLAGLVASLVQEVDLTLQRILQAPEAYPEVRPKVRRAPWHRFPSNGERAHSLGMPLIAYSASAAIDRLGFTPGLPGMMDPSMTYTPR